jgi:predicted peptidase
LFFQIKNQRNHANLIADNYLKFIVKELKPYIDNKFSVYKNAENTYIAGSSMGGLISMYAIFEYPNVFSRAACISTHWLGVGVNKDGVYDKRVPLSIFDYMKDNVPNPKNHRFWFDYGDAVGDLDSYYVEYAVNVDSIFNNSGYGSKNFRNILFNGEKHSGKSWNKRLDQVFEFLLNE